MRDVSGLDRFAGGSSTAELVIEFDRDGNAVADSSVSMEVAIEGVLPESFDFA